MEALVVWELLEIEGLNQVEAADLLERHKSWVCRRLSMIRSLAPEIIHDGPAGTSVRKGTVSILTNTS